MNLNLYDKKRLQNPLNNDILVFGSNTQGRHGKGSALLAREKFDAIYGKAYGMQGRSYAICTKDLTVKYHPSVSKEHIIEQIGLLYKYAESRNDLNFLIVYDGIGVNLNAYSNNELAFMFSNTGISIPNNVLFQESFSNIIKNL